MTDRTQWYRENDWRGLEDYKRITVDEMSEEGAMNLFGAIVKSAIDQYKQELWILWLRGVKYEDANPHNLEEYDSLIDGKAVKDMAKREAWKEFQEWKNDKDHKPKRLIKTHQAHANYNRSKPHKSKYIRDDEPEYIPPKKSEKKIQTKKPVKKKPKKIEKTEEKKRA